jgi:hypothetical protein
MTKQERDTEAHRKAAEKITLETELCRDLVNKHVSKVAEEKRAEVRLALDYVIVALRNLWRPYLSDEWRRDRKALLRLITGVFDRWADARFERPLVLQQLAMNQKNTPKEITDYLNQKKIGITECPKTAAQFESRRNADRQELSRGSHAFRVPKGKTNL